MVECVKKFYSGHWCIDDMECDRHFQVGRRKRTELQRFMVHDDDNTCIECGKSAQDPTLKVFKILKSIQKIKKFKK